MPKASGIPLNILMVDDDPDDRLLAEDALVETGYAKRLDFLENGEQLIDYLHRRGPYAEQEDWELPDLILLDLNMPKKDGREALADIKSDHRLRRIPVVVLTTSRAEEDIFKTYDLGVNSFVIKPVTFEALVRIMKSLTEYWSKTVQLPKDKP